jgi:hypothetical protein
MAQTVVEIQEKGKKSLGPKPGRDAEPGSKGGLEPTSATGVQAPAGGAGTVRARLNQAMEPLKKAALAGLGAAVLLRKEAQAMFDRWVVEGERSWKERADRKAEEPDSPPSPKAAGGPSPVARMLQRAGVPSRDDVEGLARKMEALDAKLERAAKA